MEIPDTEIMKTFGMVLDDSVPSLNSTQNEIHYSGIHFGDVNDAETAVIEEVYKDVAKMTHNINPDIIPWGPKIKKARSKATTKKKTLEEDEIIREADVNEENNQENGLGYERPFRGGFESPTRKLNNHIKIPHYHTTKADIKAENIEHKITPGNSTNPIPLVFMHLTRNLLKPAYERAIEIHNQSYTPVNISESRCKQQRDAQNFIDGIFKKYDY